MLTLTTVSSAPSRRGCDVKAQAAGVTVTLIDFTLSRLVAASGEAVFCDLAADPALFKGPKGNVQVCAREGVALWLPGRHHSSVTNQITDGWQTVCSALTRADQAGLSALSCRLGFCSKL